MKRAAEGPPPSPPRAGQLSVDDAPPAKRQRGAGTWYYGQFSKIEPLGLVADPGQDEWLVELDCFSADWFDQLHDNLDNLPAWGTVAQTAQACVVEFGLRGADLVTGLGNLLANVTDPDGAVGGWIALLLVTDPKQAPRQGLSVRLFVPAGNVTNPARIGAYGGEAGYAVLTSSAPVTGTTAAAKLALLPTVISQQH
jgi:hypothetical protein